MTRVVKSPRKRATTKKSPKKEVVPLAPIMISGQPLNPKWFTKYTNLNKRRVIVRDPQTGKESTAIKTSCANCNLNEINCTCYRHKCDRVIALTADVLYILGPCKDQKHCAYCCTHRICIHDKCGVMYVTSSQATRKCLGCGMCPDHCECTKCVTCNQLMSKKQFCVGCKGPHHSGCCESDTQIQAIGARPHKVPRTITFMEGKPVKENRLRRFISIECEVESTHPPRTNVVASFMALNKNARTWRQTIVDEGTCPEGFEINFSPASGNRFVQQIKETADCLNNLGAKTGVRCGMHVHVDARDVYYPHLKNVVELYARIEPALYALLPPWRRINRFCVPCASYYQANITANYDKDYIKTIVNPEKYNRYGRDGDKTRFKSALALSMMANMYGTSSLRNAKKAHKNGHNQRLRYMALNLHSWVYQRTIEFRHYPGTLDVEAMILWPQICGAIIERALRWSPKYIKSMNGDSYEILMQVLAPASWLSKEVSRFAERSMATWTGQDWPFVKKMANACPLVEVSGTAIGFDMQNRLYTYLHKDYVSWETQWYQASRLTREQAWYATDEFVSSSCKGASRYLAPDRYPIAIYGTEPAKVPVAAPTTDPFALRLTRQPTVFAPQFDLNTMQNYQVAAMTYQTTATAPLPIVEEEEEEIFFDDDYPTYDDPDNDA